MKFKPLMIVILCVLIVQIAGVSILNGTRAVLPKQDTVLINDILQSCQNNWGDLNKTNLPSDCDYTIIETSGLPLYTTNQKISQNLNDAIKNRDTVLDVVVDGRTVGKLIVFNNAVESVNKRNRELFLFVILTISAQAILLVLYLFYLNKRVVKPFTKLKEFAGQVSGGNLDIRLDMDKKNIFGAFTESFDLMRTELKKARESEIKLNESKKQLIADLSHDIKTPVASVKALAELASCKSSGAEKRYFEMIGQKADQINVLVGNLFSSTLEDMNRLEVKAKDYESAMLGELLEAADYLKKAQTQSIPQMLLHFDRQRLSQVLDNVISNSYKYADTPISVGFSEEHGFLRMKIEDFKGIQEDGERLFEKFYRGQNAGDKDGAGLGLYITRHLMRAMEGDVHIECAKNRFAVLIDIKIS